jgi:hypothetical protein
MDLVLLQIRRAAFSARAVSVLLTVTRRREKGNADFAHPYGNPLQGKS